MIYEFKNVIGHLDHKLRFTEKTFKSRQVNKVMLILESKINTDMAGTACLILPDSCLSLHSSAPSPWMSLPCSLFSCFASFLIQDSRRF